MLASLPPHCRLRMCRARPVCRIADLQLAFYTSRRAL
jgi:hypothetical protein